MRVAFFKQIKVEPANDKQAQVTSDAETLQIYFTIHSRVKAMDFDGGAKNVETREFIMGEEALWNKAQASKDNIERAITYLNVIAYSEVPIMGDLKSEWDVRIKEELLDQVGKMDAGEIDVLLFYITLIARGIFFLHKHIGTN